MRENDEDMETRHGAAAQRPVRDLDSSLLLSPAMDPSSLSLLLIPSLFPHQHAWQTTELRLCVCIRCSTVLAGSKGFTFGGPHSKADLKTFRLLYTLQICHKFLVVSSSQDFQDLTLTLVPCWSMRVISCEFSNVLGCWSVVLHILSVKHPLSKWGKLPGKRA